MGEPTKGTRKPDDPRGRGAPALAGSVHGGRSGDTPSEVGLESIRERARTAARAALSVKADDVKILDMHGLITYTDFMVLCTGRNTRLTRRIAEEVAFAMKREARLQPVGTEGVSGGEWILLDFLDFVVHVFTPKARDFYRLDVLWKQAPAEAVT